LLLRDESCGTSLAFPFPAVFSLERLDLFGLAEVPRLLVDSDGCTDEVPGSSSVFKESRSFTESCALCFAALTLALERIGLLSGASKGFESTVLRLG